MKLQRKIAVIWSGWSGLLLTALLGCGPAGPAIHQVKGHLEIPGGDVKVLAGHSIEAALESDSQVRAFAEVQEDGSFQLETFREGRIIAGALEGKYKARIVLGDENPELSRRIAAGIDPRFFKFHTSGLTIDVPTTGDVTLSVLRR